jgi:hypothetical protein
MIIRHGEKPGDPANDDNGGPHLATLGSGRAAALPSLFTPDPNAQMPVAGWSQLSCDVAISTKDQFSGTYVSSGINAGQSRFPTPDFLFATQGDSSSNRPGETITPLAQALQTYYNPNISINQNFNNNPNDQKNGVPGLATEITTHPETYGGKIILIAWHHGQIPNLALDLQVPSSQLPFTSWPSDRFDFVFLIGWENGQAFLKVDFQLLMYGDTNSIS